MNSLFANESTALAEYLSGALSSKGATMISFWAVITLPAFSSTTV